jgi:uroporphyrinogen decarboxylase
MNLNQWEVIKNCATLKDVDKVPVALIVDSPWIPGYTGISTIDYFTMPDKWFKANMQIKKDFPGLIFMPDYWIEFGMANEPSGFGCKISFYQDAPPGIHPIISSADNIRFLTDMPLPNPRTDGLMPIVLNLYKDLNRKVKNIGESIKIVAARGPLTIATHLMGVTEFLVALKIYPDEVKKLLEITTALSKNWLQAQAEILDEVEGIMLLDDIVGFLSKEDYVEFVHPYFKEIFSSFPEWIKIYHNDNDNTAYYEFLEDLGVNIFNFSYKQNIFRVRSLVGDKVCLMGNIPPLDVLVNGNPEIVSDKTRECLRDHKSKRGIIISAGGGTAPGTPKENIIAMIDVVDSICP